MKISKPPEGQGGIKMIEKSNSKEKVDTLVKAIDELTAQLKECLNHSEELNFRDFDRLIQRIHLMQITDF